MRVLEILEEGLIALRPDWIRTARLQRLETLTIKWAASRGARDRYPHEFSEATAAHRDCPRVGRADEADCGRRADLGADVSVQAQILNLLDQLQREFEPRYLRIRQYRRVEYIADRVAVMQAGRIVEQGTAEAVLQHPQHEYTRTLLAAVPRVATRVA